TIDEERAYITSADKADVGRLRELWKTLTDRAAKYFQAANFKPEQVAAKYQMNMRYLGQNHVLSFDVRATKGLGDLSFITDDLRRCAVEALNKRHREEYGHVRGDEMPEITGVRLVTFVETQSPPIAKGFSGKTTAAKVSKTRRANLGQGFQ